MDEESKILKAYEEDRYVHNEELTMWVGIFVVALLVALDLGLFEWIARTK